MRANKPEKLYTTSEIMNLYGIPHMVIKKHFPAPVRTRRNEMNRRRPVRLWSKEQIESALNDPEIAEIIERKKRKIEVKEEKQAAIKALLTAFDVEKLRQEAEGKQRRFILHVGPTNSGKTYDSVMRLQQAENGVYLGPLRLLALEMYDKLNMAGVPCNLLTGEESVPIPCAKHTASTIELADYNKVYEIAVIDEAQMISDKSRGDKWARAIYALNAKEIHVCMAPEAKDIIVRIIESFGAPYSIVNHQRLAPLKYAGHFGRLEDVQPGDAIIVFSRRAVLAVAAELSRKNIKASVIYGALPPVSRREEVRKFTAGETKVVVATDAIGMGISLPIKRIIFFETEKFDGEDRRELRVGEIKQIAGRAGRYGIYNEGEVLAMTGNRLVRQALESEAAPVETLYIPFPVETLDTDYSINQLLNAWNNLPRNPNFSRADMTNALYLYKVLMGQIQSEDKRLVYRLITCPVDCKSEALVSYWLNCSISILKGEDLPEPYSGDGTLEACENRYRELDIRHQLLRQIDVEEDRMAEKTELCRKINKYLEKNKDSYLRRCRSCGRVLPPTHPFGLCDTCYYQGRNYW